jgi:Ser/Thr protein kinase RdoA (MazF antagonist)
MGRDPDLHVDHAVVAFVAGELGCGVGRHTRVDAFAANVVYEVDAGGRQLFVKASPSHDSLRAEAWACARSADAGCAAPAVLALGRLDTPTSMSAIIMTRVAGQPIVAGHPALRQVGIGLRRLHDLRLPGFGWLGEAVWDQAGAFSLGHSSWLDFLHDICTDARGLAGRYVGATAVAEAATAAVEAQADGLAHTHVGSLCHGDLKPAHILVDGDRLSGVIDWGDAVVGDPVWDIARFAHRVDVGSVSLVLEGYAPDPATVEQLTRRIPLYAALWMLVDALVAHGLGRHVQAPLDAAMGYLNRVPC